MEVKVEKKDTGRSIMASRWAVKAKDSMPCHSDKSGYTTSPKEWFQKRDDLFSGQATVDNASSQLFKTLPTRPERKMAGIKSSKSGTTKPTFKLVSHSPVKKIQENSPVIDGSISTHPRTIQKTGRLTGANSTALGGDNGWGDRSIRTQALARLNSEDHAARDPPPHLSFRRALTPSQPNFFNGNERNHGMSAESKGQHSEVDYTALLEDGKENHGNTSHLLEAIARMERENIRMLPYPMTSVMHNVNHP